MPATPVSPGGFLSSLDEPFDDALESPHGLAPTLPDVVAEPPARLGLLVAPPLVRARAESQLVLDAIARGEDVVLVCGDNLLDAFGLLARARVRGLEDAMADGVLVARAFTVHQFAALLEESLPRMAEEHPAVKLALVTGMLEPFLDEDVRPAEARVLLSRVLRSLREWSARSGVRLVMTHGGAPSADASQLASLISEAAAEQLDVGLAASTADPQTRLEAWSVA